MTPIRTGLFQVDSRAHKMSKSRGNVVNPDDIVDKYGADSLRLYEMFLGPLRDTKTWSTQDIEGVHRFLARTWRLREKLTVSNYPRTPDESEAIHTVSRLYISKA